MRYYYRPASYPAHEATPVGGHPTPPPEPLSAPETPLRLAEVSEVPRGALRVQRAAEAAGWTVVATYSRGTWTHATHGRAIGVQEIVALRMSRGASRAVATWRQGKFDLAYDITGGFRKLALINDLLSHIREVSET